MEFEGISEEELVMDNNDDYEYGEKK